MRTALSRKVFLVVVVRISPLFILPPPGDFIFGAVNGTSEDGISQPFERNTPEDE